DVPAVTLNYGLFIQNVIDFIIIAFAIFMMIKVINKVRKPEEKKTAPKAETLLTEIRDLLKNK
ncbi:TPA: large conductance mechanosensitive channel protein MscL, partial [Haemophilus influenzae]